MHLDFFLSELVEGTEVWQDSMLDLDDYDMDMG